MSVEISVDSSEVDDFIAQLPKTLQAEIRYRLEEIIEEGAELARNLAPIRTGRLRASINWEMNSEEEYRLSAEAPYAVYQEFGTQYLEPKLFMTAAWDYVLRAISERILGEPIME